MWAAKEKLSDPASAAKETAKEVTAKTEEKSTEKVGRSREGRAAAHEQARAKEAQAKMQEHQEKAAHHTERDAAEHGTARVPLFHAPGGHRHRSAGTATTTAGDPAAAGQPATEKYL